MYAEANMLSVEFVYRRSEEVSVHNIQCNTVYCTLVVKLQKSSIYRLWVAYNNALRIFIKLSVMEPCRSDVCCCRNLFKEILCINVPADLMSLRRNHLSCILNLNCDFFLVSRDVNSE